MATTATSATTPTTSGPPCRPVPPPTTATSAMTPTAAVCQPLPPARRSSSAGMTTSSNGGTSAVQEDSRPARRGPTAATHRCSAGAASHASTASTSAMASNCQTPSDGHEPTDVRHDRTTGDQPAGSGGEADHQRPPRQRGRRDGQQHDGGDEGDDRRDGARGPQLLAERRRGGRRDRHREQHRPRPGAGASRRERHASRRPHEHGTGERQQVQPTAPDRLDRHDGADERGGGRRLDGSGELERPVRPGDDRDQGEATEHVRRDRQGRQQGRQRGGQDAEDHHGCRRPVRLARRGGGDPERHHGGGQEHQRSCRLADDGVPLGAHERCHRDRRGQHRGDRRHQHVGPGGVQRRDRPTAEDRAASQRQRGGARDHPTQAADPHGRGEGDGDEEHRHADRGPREGEGARGGEEGGTGDERCVARSLAAARRGPDQRSSERRRRGHGGAGGLGRHQDAGGHAARDDHRPPERCQTRHGRQHEVRLRAGPGTEADQLEQIARGGGDRSEGRRQSERHEQLGHGGHTRGEDGEVSVAAGRDRHRLDGEEQQRPGQQLRQPRGVAGQQQGDGRQGHEHRDAAREEGGPAASGRDEKREHGHATGDRCLAPGARYPARRSPGEERRPAVEGHRRRDRAEDELSEDGGDGQDGGRDDRHVRGAGRRVLDGSVPSGSVLGDLVIRTTVTLLADEVGAGERDDGSDRRDEGRGDAARQAEPGREHGDAGERHPRQHA